MAAAARRARSASLSQGLADVPLSGELTVSPAPVVRRAASDRKLKPIPATVWQDLKSFRWTTNPATSLKLIIATLSLWAVLELLPIVKHNPLSHALFISYSVPPDASSLLAGQDATTYGKGPLDIAFLAFYIVVFSFIRQAVTEYLLRPLAKYGGLNTDAKQVRFMEQAYAIVYNVGTAILGLYAMKENGSWFYKTEAFWIGYPHWRMKSEIKYYYLLQAAYWLQQMIVLGLRLEKPRSDYYQLVIHHVVTLWLVGWSYAINLTVIGVAVFVSMDIPEIFLAGSKCLNYVGLQHCSEVSFVALLLVWTYMRHYLNCVILWSVWYEFDLIPIWNRSWTETPGSPNGWWLFTALDSGRIPAWIQYQIFAPIFLLQCVNAFWSYLLWRILWRLVVGVTISDIREEGEDEDEDGDAGEKVGKKKEQ